MLEFWEIITTCLACYIRLNFPYLEWGETFVIGSLWGIQSKIAEGKDLG